MQKTLNTFPDNTQVSIAIVQGDKVEFQGYLKEEAQIQSIRNDQSIFEIGSITKVFTTQILAQLLVEGKIKLHEEVSQYLPIERLKKSKITFLHLANHTSGLPRLPDNFYTVKNFEEQDPYRNYGEQDLLEYLKDHMTLETTPGEKFAYSNLGSGLLSYLLARIEKKPFEQLVAERIFQKLGMKDSTFEISQVKATLVQGQNKEGMETHNWAGGILNGCIGILSSTRDMSLFVQQIFEIDNPVINLQTQKTKDINVHKAIALGWGIRNWENGTCSYNHGGGSEGYLAFTKINRKDKKGIVILTNISAFHPRAHDMEDLSVQLLQEIVLSEKNN